MTNDTDDLRDSIADLEAKVAGLAAQLKPVEATTRQLAEDKRRAILAEQQRREKLDEAMATRIAGLRAGLQRLPGLMKKVANPETPPGIKKLALAHMALVDDDTKDFIGLVLNDFLTAPTKELVWASWMGTTRTIQLVKDFDREILALLEAADAVGQEALAAATPEDLAKTDALAAKYRGKKLTEIFKIIYQTKEPQIGNSQN